MKNDELVTNALYQELFVENVAIYSKRLSRVDDLSSSLGVFDKTRKIYSNLTDDEKETITNLIKVVIADTASVVLGTIDGTHIPNNIDGDFELFYKNEQIQGDLQDYFLELVETNNVI
ncbi:hypothetical protein [Providencia manganoxydans]|uniref:hypothetical protein n=1 Tax=Providencia manganoxydans TaxID=2923283 RepID=UPI0029BFB3D0|nr:hypothetical protein [Providencia manganoxydans]MDX4947321.1 hypothetical protein [Providencia manganoxydans]